MNNNGSVCATDIFYPSADRRCVSSLANEKIQGLHLLSLVLPWSLHCASWWYGTYHIIPHLVEKTQAKALL